jgi:peptidyl-prolyl cis-trans isomerase A (cyclophilin A)
MRRLRSCFAVLLLSLAILGPAQAQTQAKANPRVLLATSLGEIVLELYPDKAPRTVENFLRYVGDKHYNGTLFHRVIDGFMIQGGGFGQDLAQKPTRAPIPLEASNGLKNDRGTVAMARTNAPDSATSQFFINVVDNVNLNAPLPDGHGYAVFGKVVQGMETVDKIRAVQTTTRNGMPNMPAVPVSVTNASLLAKP